MTTSSPYPPLLTTRDAAQYLRFRSTSGIRTAVMRGELVPCGGGPKACHMFTVAELDRFVAARGARYAQRFVGDRTIQANRRCLISDETIAANLQGARAVGRTPESRTAITTIAQQSAGCALRASKRAGVG